MLSNNVFEFKNIQSHQFCCFHTSTTTAAAYAHAHVDNYYENNITIISTAHLFKKRHRKVH